MRDNLCQEDELNETIEIGYEEREDCRKRINELMDDISNGVSRYPKKNEDTKIVSFEIDNDQQYYARVPLECDVKSIYEITVNY